MVVQSDGCWARQNRTAEIKNRTMWKDELTKYEWQTMVAAVIILKMMMMGVMCCQAVALDLLILEFGFHCGTRSIVRPNWQEWMSDIKNANKMNAKCNRTTKDANRWRSLNILQILTGAPNQISWTVRKLSTSYWETLHWSTVHSCSSGFHVTRLNPKMDQKRRPPTEKASKVYKIQNTKESKMQVYRSKRLEIAWPEKAS